MALALTRSTAYLVGQVTNSFTLLTGETLVATADDNGSGNVLRFNVSGVQPEEAWTLAAAASVAVGPYVHVVRVQVECLTTGITVTIGVPDTEQPKQYTSTDRDALDPAPAEGTVIYNLTTHKLNVRAASAWEEVTSAEEGA